MLREPRLPGYRDCDRIVVSPEENKRADRVVKTTRGEGLAKQLARLTMRPVELQSFHPQPKDRVLELTDVAFIHRIIWASPQSETAQRGAFFPDQKSCGRR